MKKSRDNLITDDLEVDNKIPTPPEGVDNRIPSTPEEVTAKMSSRLPAETLQKFLLAEHQAQASGDHRSLLDPAKCVSLLRTADPAYVDSIQAQVKSKLGNAEKQVKVAADILNNPEKLADQILELAGIQDRRGLMNEDLRSQNPNMNKAALVKMGAANLRNMLYAFIQSQTDDPMDNRTNIAKFNSYQKQIAAGEAPGPKGVENIKKAPNIDQGPK